MKNLLNKYRVTIIDGNIVDCAIPTSWDELQEQKVFLKELGASEEFLQALTTQYILSNVVKIRNIQDYCNVI